MRFINVVSIIRIIILIIIIDLRVFVRCATFCAAAVCSSSRTQFGRCCRINLAIEALFCEVGPQQGLGESAPSLIK